MGCGSSSTARTSDGGSLDSVVPSVGSFESSGVEGKGSANLTHQQTTNTPLQTQQQSTAPKPKKQTHQTVVYDPHTSPFTNGASTLQRRFLGRPPLFAFNFTPDWKRAGQVMKAKKEAEKSANTSNAAVDDAKDENSSSSESIAVFSASIHEDNVVAGPFSDPHVIAALVSLGAFPNRLIRLFPALDDASVDESDDSLKKRHSSMKHLAFGSKVKSSSLAKVFLTESAHKFAPSIESGRFAVRLFYGGLWQTFTIEDTIPVTPLPSDDGSSEQQFPAIQEPLFVQSRDASEYWMCLLEKALARVKGSYEDVCYTSPTELFRLLTGGSAEVVSIPFNMPKSESDDLWAHILASFKRTDLLSCSTRAVHLQTAQQSKQSRLHKTDKDSYDEITVAAHELGTDAQYSILDIEELSPELGGDRLLLLKNPLGSQQWEGRWSDGSDEWKQLEAKPDGMIQATKLKFIRKKHHHNTKYSKNRQSLSAADAKVDGIFWICYDDFLQFFQGIFICSVLHDQFDHCLTQLGEWKGKSAAGGPSDLTLPGSTGVNYGNWLANPQFRIRNTANKKSQPIVITLSKGTKMCNATNAAPSGSNDDKNSSSTPAASSSTDASQSHQIGKKPKPIWIGFRVVTNELNHTINCNPSTPSPLFGQLQVSPLHDEIITTKFTQSDSISITLPALESYKDVYIIPYTSDAGIEGDFVLNLYTNSSNILFDHCPPLPNNPIEFPVHWSKRDRTAAGNLWAETYLENPMWLLKNNGAEPAKVLLNLLKTNKKYEDINCNLRVLINTAPNPLNTAAIGTVSAPAKPLGGGMGLGDGKRGSSVFDAAAAASAFAQASEKEKKRPAHKTLQPVAGSLSPFYEQVDGTRWSQESFYYAQKSYPVILSSIAPNKEYFIVASTFTTGTECEAVLQAYGADTDQLHIEPVTKEYTRTLEGRWQGVNAAGPARRKKTYLNNPQFCFRHHASGPISVVVSLMLPPSNSTTGISHTELAINLTVATFTKGTADPNPFSEAEMDLEKRKLKEANRKAEKEQEARRKKEELEKSRAQAQLLGQSSSSHPTAQSQGVVSLRIKSKDNGKRSSISQKKSKNANMFGDFDDTSANDEVQPNHDDNLNYVNPLTGDFDVVTQTTFNGDLYKSGRLIHLFVPDVNPNQSYFLIPSTSVPGQDSPFTVQVYGAGPTAELKFDPCHLNTVGDGLDMNGLASRRASAAFGASIASHKVKNVNRGSSKPKHKKDSHR